MAWTPHEDGGGCLTLGRLSVGWYSGAPWRPFWVWGDWRREFGFLSLWLGRLNVVWEV